MTTSPYPETMKPSKSFCGGPAPRRGEPIREGIVSEDVFYSTTFTWNLHLPPLAEKSPLVAEGKVVSQTPEGLKALLVDVRQGTEEDFTRVGAKAKGAFVFVETPELLDIEGLFREYIQSAAIEKRAFAAGAAGVVYMSSRPDGVLYRQNALLGPDNKHPMLVIERGQAKRVLRLLRAGKKLFLTAKIDIQTGGRNRSLRFYDARHCQPAA